MQVEDDDERTPPAGMKTLLALQVLRDTLQERGASAAADVTDTVLMELGTPILEAMAAPE
jgi:hypothetical protein